MKKTVERLDPYIFSPSRAAEPRLPGIYPVTLSRETSVHCFTLKKLNEIAFSWVEVVSNPISYNMLQEG